MNRFILLSLLLILGAVSSGARHIIGGDISYRCNGQENYTFTFTIYRDCSDLEGAELDDPAVFTVYRGTETNNTFFRSINQPLDGPAVLIDIPENDCQDIDASLCVQRGIYTFDLNLPNVGESYHIVYQRCCRNNSITNIEDPMGTGATYTIELLPEAQNVCNNSPVFTEYPPALICANQPINYDHSAVDQEGDQLVYSFCTPLNGGGLAGVSPALPNTPNACNGVRPDPACPPPFEPVLFRLPDFSETQPMGGDPIIDIDPVTGLITGTPIFTGQYVVGVCVEEYRNGVLMSRSLRDFQFNVTDCLPFVRAILENGQQRGDTIILDYCGVTDVEITNLSVQESLIESFEWNIDSDGDGIKEPFTNWSPFISFPGVGTYYGELELRGANNCNDQAFVEINIYPGLVANFDFSYDTCVAGPVTFGNSSLTGASFIDSYLWDFGDGNTSEEQFPVHEYMIPGNLPITLTITDNNGCMDTSVQTINYFPVPAQLLIEPSEVLGCVPQEVLIDNLSFPIDETYTINWDLGDGSNSTAVSPLYTYTEPGTYSLSVDITSPIGCSTSGAWSNIIVMRVTPEAGFSFNPTEVNELNSGVQFNDESFNATFYTWLFSEEAESFEANPFYEFRDTGRQVITQIVEHPDGCLDTLTKIIDVSPFCSWFFPNAFTPNGDGKNDLFKGVGFDKNIEQFNIWIYNRWGELVFESDNREEGWNGKKNNVGQDSPQSGYVYIAEIRGPRNTFKKFEGIITLLR